MEKDKRFTAAIVGEGEDREEVESLIQNKGLQNNVFVWAFPTIHTRFFSQQK